MDEEEVASTSPDALIKKLDNWADKLSNMLTKLGTAPTSGISSGISTSTASMSGPNVEKLKAALKDYREYLVNTRNMTATEADKITETMESMSSGTQFSGYFKRLQTDSGTALKSIGAVAKDAVMALKAHQPEIINALGSGGIIAGAKLMTTAWQKANAATGGILDAAQENLMGVQRTALQIGTSFEGMAGKAERNFDEFNRAFRESITFTKSAPSEILNVNKALGETFGARSIERLGDLTRAQGGLQTALTATNAALLINKATGVDVSTITNVMNIVHTQLGESVEGSVLAFGRLKESASKSGIGFGATVDAIVKATSSLKMWGGTIGAVSPIFDMFSRSLRGTGREGLTPELLQSFVGGLNQMQTSTKALLGLQAGMGGAGGALGAALEIEEAMEKGPEGMQKVVGSLMQTLTQFGGGRIITRAEAIRDPTAQANFIMQRQLLGKLLGQDEATSTKTLDALSKMQQTGLQVGGDQEGALGDLLKAGEKVANETTTTMEQLQQQEIAAVNAGADKIAGLLKQLTTQLNLDEITKGLDQVMQRSIISQAVEPGEIIRLMTGGQRRESRAQEYREAIKFSKGLDMDPEQRAEFNKMLKGAGLDFFGAVKQAGRTVLDMEQTKKIEIPKATVIKEVREKIEKGTATPEEQRFYETISNSFKGFDDMISQMPDISQATVINEIQANMGKEMIQERVRNITNREVIRPQVAPVQAGVKATESARREAISTITPKMPAAQAEQLANVKVKVEVDQNGIINLIPIVEKIVRDVHTHKGAEH